MYRKVRPRTVYQKKLLQAYNKRARKLRDIPVERAPLCAPEVAARFVWHVSLQRALSFHSQLFYAPVLPALPISAQFLAVFLTGGGKEHEVLKLKQHFVSDIVQLSVVCSSLTL